MIDHDVRLVFALKQLAESWLVGDWPIVILAKIVLSFGTSLNNHERRARNSLRSPLASLAEEGTLEDIEERHVLLRRQALVAR